MIVDSYYWHVSDINKEHYRDEKRAYFLARLKSRPVETKQKHFLVLLQSDNLIARGTALDLFYSYESQVKKPEDNPFRKYLPEVLAEARTQLRQSPDKLNAKKYPFVVGANHASAFLVLSVVGTISDLDLIEPILNSSDDLNVIYTGCLAAIHCIETTIDVHLISLRLCVRFKLKKKSATSKRNGMSRNNSFSTKKLC